MSLLPVDEALNRILARVPDVVGESVALAEAAGRVLAEPGRGGEPHLLAVALGLWLAGDRAAAATPRPAVD